MMQKNSEGAPARVTVLCGDDGIGRERAKARLIGQIQSIHDGVIFERYDSSAETLRSFLERIITPSLFQEIRIFTINHVQSLSDADLGELAVSLGYDVPDAYIILEIDEAGKGKGAESKAAKKLKLSSLAKNPEQLAVMEFVRPPDYKLGSWIVSQVPQLFGRSIGQAEADLLLDLTGPDLETLYSELQKIDILLEPRAPITKDDIIGICGEARQMTVFEIPEAISRKDFPRVLKIIDSLFSTTFYAPVLISTLFRHFWAIFRIRRYGEANPKVMQQYLGSRGGYGNSAQNDAAYEIGKAAGLLRDGEQRKVFPVIIKPNIIAIAKRYKDDELKTIFRWLLEYDRGVKTGKIDPDQQSVQMLCYKIIRISELCAEGVSA